MAALFRSVASVQSEFTRAETEAVIGILEDNRTEVMSRQQAGYFIRDWQEIGDQVRQMLFRDARYQAIKSAREGSEQIMNIRPLYDRIMVKRIEDQEARQHGVVIPDAAKEKPQEGVVLVGIYGKAGYVQWRFASNDPAGRQPARPGGEGDARTPGRNVVSARLLTKSRLSGGGVQCYGSPGVNRVSLIELAAPIGAMPWNGSSASFCSPTDAAAVIYGFSNSAGLLFAKDSGDGVNAVATRARSADRGDDSRRRQGVE